MLMPSDIMTSVLYSKCHNYVHYADKDYSKCYYFECRATNTMNFLLNR